jgi:hypothetical protein
MRPLSQETWRSPTTSAVRTRPWTWTVPLARMSPESSNVCALGAAEVSSSVTRASYPPPSGCHVPDSDSWNETSTWAVMRRAQSGRPRNASAREEDIISSTPV